MPHGVLERRTNLTLVLLVLAALAQGGAADEESQKCVSKTEWPRFKREGEWPAASSSITYCSKWKDMTCCDDEQASRARSLFASMDYRTTTKECREVWQLLQCSVCNPEMGVVSHVSQGQGQGQGEDNRVPVCLGFCTKVYHKCATSYFAGDERFAIRGCNPSNDAICSPLGDWDLTPRDFCSLAGFRVVGQEFTSMIDIEMYNDQEQKDGRAGKVRLGLGIEEELGYDDTCYNGELESHMKINKSRWGKSKNNKKNKRDQTHASTKMDEWMVAWIEKLEKNAALRWVVRITFFFTIIVVVWGACSLVLSCLRRCCRGSGKDKKKAFPGRGRTTGSRAKKSGLH